MDCFQAMINERKRREMEAEMNRFVVYLFKLFNNLLIKLINFLIK
jgi:hypothetical protein